MGRPGALTGAALVAISPFAIFYGTEARAYALLIFLVTLSTLALVLALASGRRRWWVLYILAAAAMPYTHYFGVLALAAQGLWVIVTHRDQLRFLLLAQCLVIAAFIPWLPSYLGQPRGDLDGLGFFKPFNGSEAVRESLRFFPGHPSFPAGQIPGRWGLALVALVIAAGLAAAARRRADGRFGRPNERVVLLVLLVAVPFAGLVLYALSGPDFYIARYLSPALPAVVLLVGALAFALPLPVAACAAVLTVAAVGIGTVQSLQADHRRPGFRAAARYIDAHARPGESVLSSASTLGVPPTARTLARLAPALDVNFEREHSVLNVSEARRAFREATASGGRVFLFLGVPGDLSVPQPVAVASEGFGLEKQAIFRGEYPVVVYTYARPG